MFNVVNIFVENKKKREKLVKMMLRKLEIYLFVKLIDIILFNYFKNKKIIINILFFMKLIFYIIVWEVN